MKIRLKGLYKRNRQMSEELRGTTFDIGTIVGGVSLTEQGLTILLSDTNLSMFLKKELTLRKFKGVLSSDRRKK